MPTRKRKRKNPGGRPREFEKPYRLNLYVEAAFVEELRELAEYVAGASGEHVSIGRAITEAVRASPRFLAMRRAASRR